MEHAQMKNEMLDQLELLNSEAARKIKKAQECLPEKPVRVITLAREFGLQVYTASLPPDVSGQIGLDPESGSPSGYSIVVDRSDPEPRRRFTIAHELAHFLLHRDDIGEDGVAESRLYRSRLRNLQEVEANTLAADILMPYDKLGAIIDTDRWRDAPLAEVAAKFNVSKSALKVRLGIS